MANEHSFLAKEEKSDFLLYVTWDKLQFVHLSFQEVIISFAWKVGVRNFWWYAALSEIYNHWKRNDKLSEN